MRPFGKQAVDRIQKFVLPIGLRQKFGWRRKQRRHAICHCHAAGVEDRDAVSRLPQTLADLEAALSLVHQSDVRKDEIELRI